MRYQKWSLRNRRIHYNSRTSDPKQQLSAVDCTNLDGLTHTNYIKHQKH